MRYVLAAACGARRYRTAAGVGEGHLVGRRARKVSGQGQLLGATQGVSLAVNLRSRTKERGLGAEDAAALVALRVVEGQERVVLPDLTGSASGASAADEGGNQERVVLPDLSGSASGASAEAISGHERP